MKRIIAAATLVGLAALQIAPANAAHLAMNVINRSSSCAWVTIYTSSTFTGWSISTSPRPHFIRPGNSEMVVEARNKSKFKPR